ncbi:MAG: glutathione peroxidase [Caulobacteraceae bacterium]
MPEAATIYDFSTRRLSGEEVSLGEHRGEVMLIVNTASRCGFTPQYAGLEDLQRRLGPRGFTVIGFPCNQFGHQEPGDAEAIGEFCSLTYGVTFPMMAKVDVNGLGAHPLWAWLKARKPGLFGSRAIKWNFTKFLIDRKGKVAARFAPSMKPAALERAIEALL